MKIKIAALLLIAASCWAFTAAAANPIAARQAFRAELEKNPQAFRKYLNDKDPEIRRYAIYLLAEKDGVKAIPVLGKALEDSDPQVQYTATEALAGMAKQAPKEVQPMLEKAARNAANTNIRQVAVKASWPFHRDIKLIRNDHTWDHEVMVVKTIDLPTKGWAFTTDDRQDGHRKGFFNYRFNDKKWRKMDMGYWEFQGVDDFDGIAWYRIKFKMPAKMDHTAVEIAFRGVDESAWVWLNGIYLGCHDIGPEGWKEPFSVDCRKEIRWGEENVLTVRVYDSAFAGGIYKPVRVDILK
jgi:hypothetical protein